VRRLSGEEIFPREKHFPCYPPPWYDSASDIQKRSKRQEVVNAYGSPKGKKENGFSSGRERDVKTSVRAARASEQPAGQHA